MTAQLQGQVAIITGAGSGIGRAAALLFAQEGARLVLGDKTEAVQDTAQAVIAAGGHAVAMQMDAGLEPDVIALVQAAKTHYGQLDIAFANAGISGGRASVFESTPELWSEVLRVNLIGPWLMVKHAGQAMVDAERGGSIICTASVAGIRSGAGGPLFGQQGWRDQFGDGLSAAVERVGCACQCLVSWADGNRHDQAHI